MLFVLMQALPLLESDSLTQLMDPRLADTDDDLRTVHYMARAALLCLKNDSGHSISISEVRFSFHNHVLACNNNTSWNSPDFKSFLQIFAGLSCGSRQSACSSSALNQSKSRNHEKMKKKKKENAFL